MPCDSNGPLKTSLCTHLEPQACFFFVFYKLSTHMTTMAGLVTHDGPAEIFDFGTLPKLP